MIEDKRGVGGSRFEVRGSRFEVGGSRFEVGGWRLEVRCGASETAFTEWSFENKEI